MALHSQNPLEILKVSVICCVKTGNRRKNHNPGNSQTIGSLVCSRTVSMANVSEGNFPSYLSSKGNGKIAFSDLQESINITLQ